MNRSLPLPELFDNPRHSTKKELRPLGSCPKKRPPKLIQKRTHIRRLFPNRPIALLYMENGTHLGLNHMFNEHVNMSYFDQCFEPITKLGEGSFGEVFKVKSKEDGRYYAIKKSKDGFRSEADREERVAEVRKHGKIPHHDNCISLLHAWEQDNHVFLQMELGSTSLDVYAEKNHHITESRLWNILLDMLLALRNLHENHLIHLDVKLENIIICENGSCKLGDFGLLIDLKADLHNAIEGDAKYLAPELMVGKFTKAADVFSLGISMLELATDLELPNNGKLWHDLRDGKFPNDIKECIPKELLNFIHRMMMRDYKKRPSIKCLLRHPRLKSMMKQRRESAALGIVPDGRLTPILRTSTPLPDISPSDSPSNPTVQIIQATPPLGFTTPENSSLFMGRINPSMENSMEEDSDVFGIHTHASFLTDSFVGISPKFETPLPSYSRTNGSFPLYSSAKKLNFLAED